MSMYKIFMVTPCEYPDVSLVLSILKTAAYPVLHLGRNKEKAIEALNLLTEKTYKPFGVCIETQELADLELPEQVTSVISSSTVNLTLPIGKEWYIQVTNATEAKEAQDKQADAIIIKGNESAGKVAYESSFILFQRIKEVISLPILIQGGAGLHTSPALIMAGASGVVLDSQLALFSESKLPQALKDTLSKVDGTDTKLIDGHRVLIRPNSPKLPEAPTFKDLEPLLGGLDISESIITIGQDINIARNLKAKFNTIKKMVRGLQEAIHAHIKQVKSIPVLAPGNAFANTFNIKYPIAQGPMTRVSDEPEFANAVAEAGGLPFIALSLVKGQKAIDMIENTKKLAGDKTWGVGILGFAPQELRDEQMKYIKDAKPPVVLIAGGRPSQAKPLEELGIKTFLHVPSTSLLDMYLKEGAKGFVFEGRECGGHVGPLSSLVLWERQIDRLLEEDKAEDFNIIFAGGIHDALSASMIATMAAPLAAKGAKIGVLMGTSYLFTEEAVSCGAILQEFQDQAIEHTDTVLLETAPGHETRCLNTPFADFFNNEKKRMIEEGLDKKEIWMKLEELNVGRLRIASKGIERQAAGLVEIKTDEQLTSGMYMIGEVAALRNKIVPMAELHHDVAVNNQSVIEKALLPDYPSSTQKSLDVAIVGMACIYPGASDIDEYWKNILEGKDCVTEVPDERWNKDLYYDPNSMNGEKTPSKWGGFIPQIDFDPLEYGIPPQSLAAIEPTQLLSLMVAKKALEDAGYAGEEVNKEDISVIFGAEGGNDLANSYGFRCFFPQLFGEIPKEVDEALPKLTEDSFPGVLANVISGRISNRLDLGGRNYTVDAACASSIAAVDLACQELILGRSELVLAGGADLHNGINDYLMFSSTHALSRKGRCQTFDKDADGIALGEGIAVVALKRLTDAQADGDKIYAVIKGVGGSSDGKSLGLTAPRRSGQVKALERAYENAGISPAEAGLIEAHGTGTVVGDKTEISALTDLMLQAGATINQTHLGSVKTQIGHTKCAAGLAGLIKAALSIYHGVKPPTIQLKNPNPFYNAQTSPFGFNTQAGIWTDDKRTAGVSAFGFGGTNFHAVLQSAEQIAQKASTMKHWPAELFAFRGKSYDDALRMVNQIKELLTGNDKTPLKNLAYSLATYNDEPVQLTIVANDYHDLMEKLELTSRGVSEQGIYKTETKEGKVAFMFPGQGSQKVNMARDLFVAFPEMRKLLKDRPDLQKILFPSAAFDSDLVKEQTENIKDTRNAQPLLGVVDYAIASYLKQLGIMPDMVAGHSYGELPALCFAGVIDEYDLVDLSVTRAQSILNAIDGDPGTMLAVSITTDELEDLLKDEEGVYPVNLNAPKQQVLAGATDTITAFAEKIKAQGVSCKLIPVACAFHSPLLAGAKGLYSKVLEDYAFGKPTVDVWSNTTAAIYPTEAADIKERLSDHLVNPVKFSEQVANMYADGARIFIETGPGSVLTSLTKSIIDDEKVIITTERAGSGVAYLLNSIAAYLSTGRSVELSKLFNDRDVEKLDLDNPAQYAKRKTMWYVNGHYSYPAFGKLPAHGAKPITKQIKLSSNGSFTPTPTNDHQTEKLVQDYLTNVKTMVDAQRDVILSYLGHAPKAPINYPLPQEQPKTNTTQQAIPASTPQPAQAPALTAASIKSTLMAIVSDKTGYPEDMLGMDMDMEADLSIDSIKRMEITAELKNKLGGFNLNGKNEEQVVEQLASIKTLNGLVDWVLANAPQPAATPAAQPAAAPAPTANIDIKGMLISIVSEKTGYPDDMLGLEMDLEADLSIDSIKRMEIIGELKNKLGGFGATDKSEEQLVEELSAIKTLSGLISWLENRIQPSATTTSAPTATTQAAPAASTSGGAPSQEEVKKMLTNIISEKTGYPEDMLGMDLDMEADLSIDSIKRMEIINDLKNQLGGFKSNSKSEEALIEELASIKTLQGLVNWICSASAPAAEPSTPTAATNGITPAADIPKKTGLKERLVRLMFKLTNSKDIDSNQSIIQNKKFAITNDGGKIAESAKSLLENSGAQVDIVSEVTDLKGYDGLILLDIFESSKRPQIIDFVSLIKRLDPQKAQWIYVISDLKAHFKMSKDISMLRNFQGYSGFLKSLNKELPHTHCRTINLENPLPDNDIANIMLHELFLQDNHIEVFYKGTQRQTYELVPTELASGTAPEVTLDSESVVLVLGGAQGITAEMMIRFSREYACNYVLVGRSADPREEAEDAFTFMLDKDELKKAIIKEGSLKKPAEIEAKTNRIYKRNQILATIRSLEANGAKVNYKALDLRNEAALSGLIDDLYNQYGRIDGVVHGAGLLEDKLFQDKTPESFERVFSTKVTPIRVMAEKLKDDVQFLVLFSSVASVYGNRGQTDYAAANSVLDIYAWELKEKFKGKTISINWGPWKGAGMVSPTLAREYERRGIALIPLEEGMESFVNEIKYGKDSQVLIMAE